MGTLRWLRKLQSVEDTCVSLYKLYVYTYCKNTERGRRGEALFKGTPANSSSCVSAPRRLAPALSATWCKKWVQAFCSLFRHSDLSVILDCKSPLFGMCNNPCASPHNLRHVEARYPMPCANLHCTAEMRPVTALDRSMSPGFNRSEVNMSLDPHCKWDASIELRAPSAALTTIRLSERSTANPSGQPLVGILECTTKRHPPRKSSVPGGGRFHMFQAAQRESHRCPPRKLTATSSASKTMACPCVHSCAQLVQQLSSESRNVSKPFVASHASTAVATLRSRPAFSPTSSTKPHSTGMRKSNSSCKSRLGEDVQQLAWHPSFTLVLPYWGQ